MSPLWTLTDDSAGTGKPKHLGASGGNPGMLKDSCFGVDETEIGLSNAAATAVAHTGWVQRHDKGGGRYYYENLVAGGGPVEAASDSTTDDTVFPDA